MVGRKYFYSLPIAILLILASAFAREGSNVQARAKKPRGPKVVTRVIPDFTTDKEMGFHVYRLPKKIYNFSRAEIATPLKSFAGSGVAQPIVYVTYGYKRGGLVRLYQTRNVKGLKLQVLPVLIANSRIYHDSYSDSRFVTKTLRKGDVDIVVTGLSPELVNAAIPLLY